jgi:hypothetical protein
VQFALSDIGQLPGDTFGYVVTYLNPATAFRSDEFHGDIFPAGNSGAGPATLSSFNTFASVPEPTTALLLAAGLAGLAAAGRGRSSH